MKKTSFKPGTMLNPLPVVMVSCGNMDNRNIITVAWTGIINSEPPMTYISVRKSRHSFDIIEKSKEFVINLTTEDLAKATDFCGVKSGRDYDKFNEMKLTPILGKCVDCVMIDEAPVNIECKVREIMELGSHYMFISDIVNVNVNDDLIDDRGRICLDEAGLLCYNHGEYFGIKKQPLGKFGYSIMKPKTKKKLAKKKLANKKTSNKKSAAKKATD